MIGRLHLATDTRPGRDTGPGLVVRATVRDPVAAGAAARAGASSLGVGLCFATSAKTGLPAPIGSEGVAAVVGATRVRVIAIGGVRPDRVSLLLAAGAHGVAVVDAVSGAPDPRAAVYQLLAALGAVG